MSDFIVVPDILASNIGEVKEKLSLISGISDRLHIDIIDGIFADNLTVAPADLQAVDLSEYKFDLHLMVDDPMAWVEECVAISPYRLISQIERMGSQGAYIDWVKGYDVSAGLALDFYTPVSSLERDILHKVDAILLMSVPAGFSGQKFDPRVIKKIEELRDIYDGSIIIDGGIDDESCALVREAGASEVAVNSYLWEGDSVKERMTKLYE